ncbi:peptidoglycan recognition protein family protein [Streptomyces sp. SP18CS02]|uniref:peptidoglycan recognition protein family protein n=1 Tax=Streptomyces sp. SP18CS02 TaxID=3002531 RepID=UPI002E787F38|nr:N-acetylmuramoyl-L-alanine amidase [Streptomyces sp. SP18CS02]MEE1753816.1 N-acetylmuramoyl-L-alanine amidase [Streptomyces sp. SP18CS02]
MAWCPFARKLELQPESDQQPAIRPTQFILHSIAAPWTAQRVYEYWQTTNLESHFGLGYAGDLAQYIGTETRADANAQANRRPDGTGAVSIETASNLKHTDPWTEEQIERLIALGAWLHHRHGIPLRICRSASDPGYGYHRLHAAWSSGGTACPGDARVRQFKDVVFPGIVARANGDTPPPTEEDPMPSVITESEAGGPALEAGAYVLLRMAADTALLQGPCAYTVTAYATVSGRAGTRITMRFHDLAIATRRPSLDLPIDCGVIGADGVLNVAVTRSGNLGTNEQLKVEIRADQAARVDRRVLRALRWAP